MLGVGNALLTNFKEFIDNLLEKTPLELQVLRTQEMTAEKEWWDNKKDELEWTTLNGPELASCVQALQHIKEILDFELEGYGGNGASKAKI